MAKVFLFNPYTGTPRRMDVCAVVLRCRCLGATAVVIALEVSKWIK